MVNVGLRGYLWNLKSEEAKVTRELWYLNGTYLAYRNFISNAKEVGFPDQQPSWVARQLIDDSGDGTVEASGFSATSSKTSSTSQQPAPYTFSGMKAIFDDGNARTTIVKFGYNSSDLLAWGSEDGKVRVAALAPDPPSVRQVLSVHRAPVTDLGWSADNSLLLSAAGKGGLALWLSHSGTLVRTFESPGGMGCARFHPLNQNLLVSGTGAGELRIYNASTGRIQVRLQVTFAGEGCGICIVEIAGGLLFAADSRGTLHTLRWELKNGMPQTPQLLARFPAIGRPCEPTTLLYVPWNALIGGPALLVATTDHMVLVLRVLEKTGRLEVGAKAEVPLAARKISAAFCPPISRTEPEYISMGGEDTAVYIYDVSRARHSAVVVNKLQGHMAPVTSVSWSFDEELLASCDCDGVVIVWRRDKSTSPA
eukprot:jgi/Botrbrau1/19812/Bobra.0124s0055.1